MKNQQLFCKQVNQIDLVDYLEKLGHRPIKIRNNDYWYLSPLREEKNASFKVNRRMNLWFDHGIGKGGTLIDFGKYYYHCTVKELLAKLETEKTSLLFSFHPHENSIACEKKNFSNDPGKIIIVSSQEIRDPTLRQYLHDRKIPLAIANQYCHEVTFKLYSKKHIAIGFQNNAGGFELRNQYFKGCSTPKEPKLIQRNGEKELSVFEGFFNFLSFQTIQQAKEKNLIELLKLHTASLVLNSISFFEKSRNLMEPYSKIHLFLDRDRMGIKYTQDALKWSDKYKDQSHNYRQFKDLNECLIKSEIIELKQSHRKGLHL